MPRQRLGTRLTLSYIRLAACIAAVFVAGTGAVLYLQMRSQTVRFAIQDIETVEGLLNFTPDGRLTLHEDYHNHPESRKVLERYLEVLGPDGSLLYRNDRLSGESLGGPPGKDEGVGGYSPRRATLKDNTPVLIVSRHHTLAGRPILIRVAHSEEQIYRALQFFAIAAGLMFPLALGAAALAARRMSRRILSPVQKIAAQAGRITSNRLHEQIPVHGTGDEIDQLAEVFNRMLTRLDESFRELKQFTADASHELRTPLAAIRAVGEVGLDRDKTVQEYRELVGSMLEEVNRLTRLVDDLLMVSRGDSGTIQLNCSRVRVLSLVRDTVSLLEPLANEKAQPLILAGDDAAEVEADPVFLRQALINIVHNAIKYSPGRSAITINVASNFTGFVTISIEDQGPGIPSEHQTRIFDRFYRIDRSRSTDAGGFGLGLAIAQGVVQAHKGTLSVTSDSGKGSTFRILLPQV
jgi:heavy metal sensor kinase